MVEEEASVEDEMKVKRARRRERVVNMGVEKRTREGRRTERQCCEEIIYCKCDTIISCPQT